MRQWRVGTLSMGILLIVVGILLIIQRINGVSSITLILKWWPLVLVVLGIEILAYSYFSKEEIPKIRYDGLSIFIVIVIIIFSLTAYILSSIPFDHGRLVFNNSFPWASKYETAFTKNYTIDSKGSSKVDITNAYGNVEIEKSDSGKVEVTALIKIRNNDEAYAKQIADKVIKTEQSDGIRIETKTKYQDYDKSKIQNVTVDLMIKVPPTLDILATDEFGNVSVKEAGKALVIVDKNGKVSVDSVGGDLKIKNEFGDIEAEGIEGKCDITNRNGNIEVRNVNENLKISNEFGNIDLSGIKGDVNITDRNANISGSAIGGNVNTTNRFGNITFEDIKGSIVVNDKNGGIEIRDVKGDVKADNEFGNIKVAGASKAVQIKDRNGQIEFESEKILEKDLKIENSFGNITLNLPDKQNGYVKAYTEYGQIDNSFDLKVSEDNNEKTIDQQLGSGGIKIDLKNRNGNIDIN